MQYHHAQISTAQKRFWSPSIRELTPYQPGEQALNTAVIKLNTNENPYPPSPQVMQAIMETLWETADVLRLYPDPDASKLCKAIANTMGLEADNVFVGNGSDEVLAFIFKAFFQHTDQPVLFPDISYSFYPVYTQFYQLNSEIIPVNQNYEICVEDYEKDTAGIIIANPNAPTGIALELQHIKTLLEMHPDHVVVIDEAYIDFGAESAVSLIKDYDNLVVCQTTSKSRSLAGLRVGFALAQPHLIQALNIVKNSFNSFPVDSLAIAAATAAFEDHHYFKQTCLDIIQQREFLVRELEALGFIILPSKTNFLFVKHPSYDALTLAQQLKHSNILVRHFNQPRINNFLRISVGIHEHNLKLIDTLRNFLS
ncbi:histidinol-phosphate transaminase [Acinetobacter sp. MB5]|uniref:histidinol-phosphate transaminase n=1 Tax=Acinetobacter sp. MB5 TaxID=2069438 RepID=UPI000DD04341|nr:histidinol-phosphate transaminase [Acinetobacter sp. MB5]